VGAPHKSHDEPALAEIDEPADLTPKSSDRL